MLPDYKDFAEYIARRYGGAGRIVEVGVGREFSVIRELRDRGIDVAAVDILGEGALADDVTHPRMEVYRGAELIYAVRPNPELYPFLKDIARRVGADLIIRPFTLDPRPEGGELVNYKKSSFYLFRR
jgi:hypothetical protein